MTALSYPDNAVKNRISLTQALLLGLMMLTIYFPIIIYVNVKPSDILAALNFLVFPAVTSYIFYVLFIIAADRIMGRLESLMGGKFLVKSQVPAIIVSIPVAIIATLFSQYFFEASLPEELDQEQLTNLKRLNTGLTFLIFLSISYLTINRKVISSMKDLELRSQRLVNENTLAQFEALKNQVSPYFLLNSLNILSSLVHSNPAEQFIDRLSKTYRYILEQKDNDLIPLRIELDFINSYAFIVKTFDQKIQVDVDILDDIAVRYSISPLTLQLLVENAIRHNSMSTMEPLRIKISIEENYLVVENVIRPRDTKEIPASTDMGLRNITNRYNLLTSEPVIVVQNQEYFSVKIPLIS